MFSSSTLRDDDRTEETALTSGFPEAYAGATFRARNEIGRGENVPKPDGFRLIRKMRRPGKHYLYNNLGHVTRGGRELARFVVFSRRKEATP